MSFIEWLAELLVLWYVWLRQVVKLIIAILLHIEDQEKLVIERQYGTGVIVLIHQSLAFLSLPVAMSEPNYTNMTLCRRPRHNAF